MASGVDCGECMRDQGLQRAIDAAGGVSALAVLLGISQPSVSGWTRVPSDRISAIEAATGVARTELRPDLFAATSSAQSAPGSALDDVDLARARGYQLLAHLLAKPPTQALLDTVGEITGDPTPLGIAWITLAAAARQTPAATVGEEYFKLFIGVGRGDVLPFASYYLAGFLHERPLATARADLAKLGIERRRGVHEPEDHIATLCDAMAGMIDGTYPANQSAQDAFFCTHLKPWAPRLFADIAIAPSANFYRAVADVGTHWIDLEIRAAAIGA